MAKAPKSAPAPASEERADVASAEAVEPSEPAAVGAPETAAETLLEAVASVAGATVIPVETDIVFLRRWFAVEDSVIHNGETLAASAAALLTETEFDALRRAGAIAAHVTWQDGEGEDET